MYKDADDMWKQLSIQYTRVKERDPDLWDGLQSLGSTVGQFSEVIAKTQMAEGITLEVALDAAKAKKNIRSWKMKEKRPFDDDDFAFLLFVLLKNLEHSGMIKIINKPERIVKAALKNHEEKKVRSAKKYGSSRA